MRCVVRFLMPVGSAHHRLVCEALMAESGKMWRYVDGNETFSSLKFSVIEILPTFVCKLSL